VTDYLAKYHFLLVMLGLVQRSLDFRMSQTNADWAMQTLLHRLLTSQLSHSNDLSMYRVHLLGQIYLCLIDRH
jgi:hypothetical protein